LIEVCGADTQCDGLQRKPFIAAPGGNPLCGGAPSVTNTAIPAELRTCLAYLSFSLFALKRSGKNGLPIQRGTDGFPVVRENNPSPVRMASSSLKRIQDLSSATKARSCICAVFASMTCSRICSIFRLSVKSSSSSTPLRGLDQILGGAP